MGLLAWIGSGIAGLVKLVALPFAKLRGPRVRPYLRWMLHGICVLAILACLGWLNMALHLEKVVRAPWPMLRMCWLPLLFVFIYSLAWMAWWLWHVATSPNEQSPFPELDDAWQEGLRALEQAKIDVMQTPVYLLVGGSADRMEGLTQATGWSWEVQQTPKHASAPLRLCATRDAIFINLANVSASGVYVTRLLSKPTHEAMGASLAIATPIENATSATESTSQSTVATATATRRTAQRGLELIEQSLALLETEKTSQAEVTTYLDGVRVDEDELLAAQERLAHFCRLLAEERAPFCPANGVLTLIAWEATGTQATSNRTAVLLDRDLQMINNELRIAAPRLAIVSDIDSAEGGADLIARIPPDQRQRRFGVRFPRVAKSDRASWPHLAEEGVVWLTRELLPALVYRVLRLGVGDQVEQDTWKGNAHIFRFLNAVRERESRLVRLLQRGVLPSLGSAPLGGLFFSANNAGDDQQQAFLAGVMPQLQEMQNEVSWSSAALRSDARARRWTVIGYGVLALIVGALVAVAVIV